jgi:hypothetical protein
MNDNTSLASSSSEPKNKNSFSNEVFFDFDVPPTLIVSEDIGLNCMKYLLLPEFSLPITLAAAVSPKAFTEEPLFIEKTVAGDISVLCCPLLFLQT